MNHCEIHSICNKNTIYGNKDFTIFIRSVNLHNKSAVSSFSYNTPRIIFQKGHVRSSYVNEKPRTHREYFACVIEKQIQEINRKKVP